MLLRRAWGAKKLDESCQRNAQAHAADDQLEDIHFVEGDEGWPLLQVEEAECR